MQKAFAIIAAGRTGTGRKARCDHGSIERDPIKLLPEKYLERGDIAMTQNDLGRSQRNAQAVRRKTRCPRERSTGRSLGHTPGGPLPQSPARAGPGRPDWPVKGRGPLRLE